MMSGDPAVATTNGGVLAESEFVRLCPHCSEGRPFLVGTLQCAGCGLSRPRRRAYVTWADDVEDERVQDALDLEFYLDQTVSWLTTNIARAEPDLIVSATTIHPAAYTAGRARKEKRPPIARCDSGPRSNARVVAALQRHDFGARSAD